MASGGASRPDLLLRGAADRLQELPGGLAAPEDRARLRGGDCEEEIREDGVRRARGRRVAGDALLEIERAEGDRPPFRAEREQAGVIHVELAIDLRYEADDIRRLEVHAGDGHVAKPAGTAGTGRGSGRAVGLPVPFLVAVFRRAPPVVEVVGVQFGKRG